MLSRRKSGLLAPRFVNAASPPVNTVAPVISGNVRVGQTLTTTDGTWTGTATIVFTYQWKRAGSNIASATNSTYVLVEADAGAAITCVVTGTNGVGNSSATSNSLSIDVYLVFLSDIVDPTDVGIAGTYSGGVWNSVSLGTAAANRKIVAVICGRSTGAAGTTVSALTIAGNSSVENIESHDNLNSSIIRNADVASGSTGNIVVTVGQIAGAGGGFARIGVGLWAMYGAGSSTASDTKTSSTDAGSVSLTVPAKGVAVGGSTGLGGVGCTWTGLTKRYDRSMETTVIHSGADLNSNAGGSISMNADWSTTPTDPIAAFASWGP